MTKSIDDLVEGEDYYSDMYKLLGTEDPEFGIKQVKELLKGILEGGYIENFDDVDLWILFSTRGLLNRNSKYASVFDKLAKMPKKERGEVADELKGWVKNKDDKSVPLEDRHSGTSDEDEIQEGGHGENDDSTQNQEPLRDEDYGKHNLQKRLSKIFLNGEKLESFVDDPDKRF